MAESIAIFGLAANIVQFLDIGSKFVSSAWKIYSSGRNGMGKISDLVRLTGDLQTILKGLQTSDENINATIEGENNAKVWRWSYWTLSRELTRQSQFASEML